MQRIPNKQAGFNIVELFIVVAVVGVLGVAGWFVYQHNRVKPADAAGGAQTTNQGTSQQTTTATPTTVLKIPELGIQITVPNGLKDLTYQIKTLTLKDGSQSPTAFFSTPALTAYDPNCAGINTPIGSLGRGNGQYPSNDPTAALDYGQLVKQFPTFYIAVGYPNGACSTKPNFPEPASGNWKDEYSSSLSTIQSLN